MNIPHAERAAKAALLAMLIAAACYVSSNTP
jgi:hypothetical protein